MTPKQKAEELVHKFGLYLMYDEYADVNSKECALICVDEMIEFVKQKRITESMHTVTTRLMYLESVKKVINKI